MSKGNDKIIMMDSDEAASIQTVTGGSTDTVASGEMMSIRNAGAELLIVRATKTQMNTRSAVQRRMSSRKPSG